MKEEKKKSLSPEASSDLIVQHNNLVQASYSLSLQEKRIVLWLSSQVKSYDKDFKNHIISIKDFCKIAGLKSGNMYNEIEQTTKSLMQKVLEIRSVDDNTLEQISWVSYSKYLHNEGRIVLRFDPALKKYLLELNSRFTKTTISQTFSFKSSYSIRLYEFMSQFRSVGVSTLSVEEIKYRLDLAGKKYSEYNNFKRRIIESSCKEINEKSDLYVEFEEIKIGKKVSDLKFYIKKARETPPEISLNQDLINCKINPTTSEEILKKYSPEAVRQGLMVLKTYRGKVKNPAVFLEKAIQAAWQPFVQEENSKIKINNVGIKKEIEDLDEDEICKSIRVQFLEFEGGAEYISWVRILQFSLQDRQLVIVAPNKFVVDWLNPQYSKKFIQYSNGRVDSVKLIEHETQIEQEKTKTKKPKK